jgi:predicted molibdopterin-dependent oxidoreductase YjgC
MTHPKANSENGEKKVSFHFNGKELFARRGVSIAAALIDNDERITRTTRINQQPRGIFCGIGICFDCLITVDGLSDQRACLTEITQGMQVETEKGFGIYVAEDLP